MGYPILTSQNALFEAVDDELVRAQRLFPPMQSAHEGHSVIREEFEEFWEAVRADNIPKAREEAMQLAAMCVRFLVDVGAIYGVPKRIEGGKHASAVEHDDA